ncbi:MAG: hypothetical protein K5793_03730 [Nitrosarchaeum sp.]|nr:hypothetical protein [Nitrosarchaeum sp.]
MQLTILWVILLVRNSQTKKVGRPRNLEYRNKILEIFVNRNETKPLKIPEIIEEFRNRFKKLDSKKKIPKGIEVLIYREMNRMFQERLVSFEDWDDGERTGKIVIYNITLKGLKEHLKRVLEDDSLIIPLKREKEFIEKTNRILSLFTKK